MNIFFGWVQFNEIVLIYFRDQFKLVDEFTLRALVILLPNWPSFEAVWMPTYGYEF